MQFFVLPLSTRWFDYPFMFLFPSGFLTLLMNLLILGIFSIILLVNYFNDRDKAVVQQIRKKLILLYFTSIAFFPVAMGALYYLLITVLYAEKSKKLNDAQHKIKHRINEIVLILLILLISAGGIFLILRYSSLFACIYMIIGCIVGIIIAIKNHQNGTEEVRNNVETSVDWKKYRRIAYAGLIILIIFSASVFSFRNQIQVPNSIEGVVNPSESVPLRIVSYNIRRGGSEDNPLNLWKNRKSHFVEYLNTFEADIIGVQEAFIQQVNYIVANLKPQYAYCGVGRGDGVFADEHSVILFREDKFKLMDTGTFWLSANPSVPLRTWGSACLRVCTWARFQDIPSEKQFFVFCTHFDFNGYAKTESAKLIQNVIGNYTGSLPVFLIGDFNTWSDEPAFQYLDNYGAKPLQDSYRLIHGEDYPPEYSFNDWNSSFVAEYDSRLDYIFISANIYAQNILIPKDTYGDGLTYSDHYPVVLDCIL